ncbi:MAG TPA: YceI family protein [Candidatus Didemnitutus sp.]|nr:YceI family protein [Candidatus Didemnitutus sp.]
MRTVRLLLATLALPLALCAAERPLKIDPARSYVEVDVKSTLKNFTAHLDAYVMSATVDDTGKIKNAVLQFRFADLKTGDDGRNADMLKWLGGADATGKFELGILAVAPDGQGQATGKLTFHDNTKLIEFSLNIDRADGTYTITGSPTFDYRDWNLKVYKRDFLLKVDSELRVRFKFTGVPAEPAAHG